jgi:hypothetical protein
MKHAFPDILINRVSCYLREHKYVAIRAMLRTANLVELSEQTRLQNLHNMNTVAVNNV